MTNLQPGVTIGVITSKTLKCPFHDDSHQCDAAIKNVYLSGDATKLGTNLDSGQMSSSTVLRDLPPLKSVRKFADPDDLPEEDRWVDISKINSSIAKGKTKDEKERLIYPTAYSAHHLIPAKESLKAASKLHRFIDKRKGSGKKLCCNLGYDVNGTENGVWLPGLHAVNSKGIDIWGSSDEEAPDGEAVGRKRIRRKAGYEYAKLDGPKANAGAAAFADDNLKWLYIQAAMTLGPAGRRQFHDRHKDYSDHVKDHLLNLSAVLEKFAGIAIESNCDKCKKSTDKLLPPIKLLQWMNNLSFKLRGKLVSKIEDSKYYTSSWCDPQNKLGASTATSLKNVRKKPGR
jgi:hypothetical protein